MIQRTHLIATCEPGKAPRFLTLCSEYDAWPGEHSTLRSEAITGLLGAVSCTHCLRCVRDRPMLRLWFRDRYEVHGDTGNEKGRAASQKRMLGFSDEAKRALANYVAPPPVTRKRAPPLKGAFGKPYRANSQWQLFIDIGDTNEVIGKKRG